MSEETWVLEHRDVQLVNVHPADRCAGRPCPIHNRSEHHMRHLPQLWRGDRGIIERVCEHGVGHPDPDQPWPGDSSEWIHGCCWGGCCRLGGDP